jgi:hypothetical protein
MLAEVWREVNQRCAPLIAERNAQERRLVLVTGGVIEMWSLDAYENIRGRKYKRGIIDEAAMVPYLGDAWQSVIRPTLTDLIGDMYMYSTPKGRNFFWECFQRGLDPFQEEWACWQMPTSTNPYIDPREIEAARRELPERIFQQEYLALFLESAGGVFRKVRASAKAPRVEPYPGHFVMGLDWGQKNDFTVLVVIDTATGRMVDFDRFNQIDWSFQRSRVKAMADKWQVSNIIAEHNSIGGPNIEALQNDGLPVRGFEMTASSKPPLIESLGLAFEQSEIEIFDEPVLIGELEAFERTVSEHTGRSRFSAPEGFHDDCVISLALAWHGAQDTGSLLLW